MNIKIFFFLLCLVSTVKYAGAQVFYPGDPPGKAMLKRPEANQISLENNVVRIVFQNNGKRIFIKTFEDKKLQHRLKLTVPLFELVLNGNNIVTSNEFTLQGLPAVADISAEKSAGTNADKFSGKKYTADLINKKSGLKVHWEAVLKNSSNYICQVFSFTATDSIKISEISLVNLPANIAVTKIGTVDGSPIIHANMFFALEHPMSQFEQNKTVSKVFLLRSEPVTATSTFTTSSVWGVTPVNQLRRGFLYYLERERASPYHQLLHYNSWFDVSYSDETLNDSVCLDRIRTYGDSLIKKRHTKLDAFLFDDGWDDYKTLWQFNSGFSHGFTNVSKVAEVFGAGIGVWLSPWGGYGMQKNERVEYGKKQDPPFETNENGFSLAGPVYYNRFKEITSDFINKYNVNIFKFDGVGAGNGASGASIAYQKDIEAFLKLLTDLRKLKPALYLSLTVGTWPSVYWLKYGDATWRAGEDTGLEGKGSSRQQWITYRSSEVYKNIVLRAPLYPLNALMYDGITIADHGNPAKFEMDDKDIADEIWSFFGTGTSLQELYINPHKLNSKNWDCLAKAISWARENEKIMADIHWVGGDPAKEQVYGYAAWNKDEGILMLRNPSAQKKSFGVDVSKVFELPAGFEKKYFFFDAKIEKVNNVIPLIGHGKLFTVSLKPFEVKIMDAKLLRNKND